MPEVQQRLPWGRPSPIPAPFELHVALCAHNRLVGFWEGPPSPQQVKQAGGKRVRTMGAFEFQRELGRTCPFGCVDLTTKGDPMGVVKETPQLDPHPDGPARVVCVDNYTRENVDTAFGKKTKEYFVFESEQVNPKTGKPFLIIASFTNSLDSKSNLRKFLVSWRGKQFTSEELKGFDCEKVVGAPAFIHVLQNHKDDGSVYANIESIMPMPNGMDRIKPSGSYVRFKDRDKQPAQGATAGGGVDDGLPF